ncbi:MAG: hypothetical protein ABEK10_01315 [Candidatus Nanosalina sp.]
MKHDETQQKLFRQLDEVLKIRENPASAEKFRKLKTLEETVRSFATDEEKNQLDEIEEPSIQDSIEERVGKIHERLSEITDIMNSHGYWGPKNGDVK